MGILVFLGFLRILVFDMIHESLPPLALVVRGQHS